jgi:hypothetical protein
MSRAVFAFLCLQVLAAFAFPTYGGSSSPQYIQVEANWPLPVVDFQAPPAPVQEELPKPIYTMSTNVRQPILGSVQTAQQITLPEGQSATEMISSLRQPAMVRQVAGKNMPILNGPEAITLPVQELTPQNLQYPVKSTEQQKESQQQTVTQQVFAPSLQRIYRHAVPIHHINVNRYIQPIVNREIKPVLEVQVQEGKAAPARIAQKKGHEEAPSTPETPEEPEETPETSEELPSSPTTPSASSFGGGSSSPFRTTMYRSAPIRFRRS